MSKSIPIHIFIILLIGVIVYYLQTFVFSNSRFGLENVYLFHVIASTVVYVALELLSKTQKFKNQIGFLYLGTIFFKVVLFVGIFNGTVMSVKSMTDKEIFSLLLPVFIFLFLEVYFISKILNKTI